MAAQVALDLGLRVVAPLPMPVALYREDFDQPGSLAVFERQLQQAEVLTQYCSDKCIYPQPVDAGSAPAGPRNTLSEQYWGLDPAVAARQQPRGRARAGGDRLCRAQRRQAQAEDILGFMLGDLRKKLGTVGRLDLMRAVDAKATGYFATLDPRDLSERALEDKRAR